MATPDSLAIGRSTKPPGSFRPLGINGVEVGGEATLVVVQPGAHWPHWLGMELAGELDALVLVCHEGDDPGQFLDRVQLRIQNFSRRVVKALVLEASELSSTAGGSTAPQAAAFASDTASWLRELLGGRCEVRQIVSPRHRMAKAGPQTHESGELPCVRTVR